MRNLIILLVLTIFVSGCTQTQESSSQAEEVSRLQRPAITPMNLPSQTKSKTETQPTLPPQPEQQLTDDIVLTGRTVVMETNYGTVHIRMLDKIAPKTTENFIRLAASGYYNGLTFHRMVESPNMKIIQGGDPGEDGTGGQSIWGKAFEDEIRKPDDPESLRDESVYANYDGRVATYQKGYLAMANSGPNTNGSQFFLMLGDTLLPPNYTIFGVVDEQDFEVLDTILSEVEPDSPTGDGPPDKHLGISSASLEE